jgi:hypothetical protein
MTQPSWLERINFARIIAILAIVFGISLGLCGLNFFVVTSGMGREIGIAPFLGFAGIAELALMALSGIGLVLAAIVWVIASMFGQFNNRNSEPERLFDDKGDEPKN